MRERKVDWNMLQKMYKNNDIQAVFHYPIEEVSQNYHVKMFEVAQRLQDLVENKGRTVFIHCTSGVSRGPTVALLHQCLYKKVNTWESVSKTSDYIKNSHHLAHPNIKVVTKIIRDNQEFQDKQMDRETQDAIQQIMLRRKADEQQRILDEKKYSQDK